MRFIANVIWVVVSGVWLAFFYAIAGVLLCCTVIGIPFGLQVFKIARYVLWPFGYTLVKTSEVPAMSTIGNILWLPFGCLLFLAHLGTAAVLAITIIGFPFAIANLKISVAAFTPFGRTVMSNREVQAAVAAHRLSANDIAVIPERA
ncbi:MAG: YccF domain-containing protein [Solirubrobacteraceae bacterium]|nr:YccF domain-containing protein [Solirubrobacteraceae bacterium]